jgi:tetratricopeptide (TPR) repeat protein
MKKFTLLLLLLGGLSLVYGQSAHTGTAEEGTLPAGNQAFLRKLDTLRNQVTQGRQEPEALHTHLKELLTYCEQHDKVREKGEVYQLMGVNQEHLGNYVLALKYFNTSIGIFEAINDEKGIAQNENSIGVIYWYLEYYTKAIDCFRKSIEINQRIQPGRRGLQLWQHGHCIRRNGPVQRVAGSV